MLVSAARLSELVRLILPLVIDGNEMIYRDYVDISVAVATPKVLFTDATR
jgi:pyruvate/2-oxoglutarate dehydrogenase complex dihydrolipoamide acyltransferase (E2) component